VKSESSVEEKAGLERTTSTDVPISFTTTASDVDMALGDDVVSSTSDVITCEYEGLYRQFVNSYI